MAKVSKEKVAVKAKKNEGILTEWHINAIFNFCKKQGIEIPSEDDFDLMVFLRHVSEKYLALIPAMLEIERNIGKIIEREGKESDQYGGSPTCGAMVTLDLDECPYTGDVLGSTIEEDAEDVAEEEEENADVDGADDEKENDDEENEEDGDDGELDEDESENDDENEDDDEELSGEDDELPSESEDDDEELDADDEDEVDEHPKKKKRGRKPKELPADKAEQREAKKKELAKKRSILEKRLPEFKKDPMKLEKLSYTEMITILSLLGAKKAMTIGDKDAQLKWAKNALRSYIPPKVPSPETLLDVPAKPKPAVVSSNQKNSGKKLLGKKR